MMQVYKKTFPVNADNAIRPVHVATLQAGELFMPIKTPTTIDRLAPTPGGADRAGKGGYLPYLLIEVVGVDSAAKTYTQDQLDPVTQFSFIPSDIRPIYSPFGTMKVYLHWPYGNEAFTLACYVGNAFSIGNANVEHYGTQNVVPAAITSPPNDCGDILTLMSRPFYSGFGDNSIGCITMLVDPSIDSTSGNYYQTPYYGLDGIKIIESGATDGTNVSPILTNVGATGIDIFPSNDYFRVYGNYVKFYAKRFFPAARLGQLVPVSLRYV